MPFIVNAMEISELSARRLRYSPHNVGWRTIALMQGACIWKLLDSVRAAVAANLSMN